MSLLPPVLIAGLLAPSIALSPLFAATDPATDLDAYVERGVADWGVPGLAIAVVKDGEVVLAKGYGMRQLGAEGAVDEHTLFAIGSTTKAMTAAALGLLVDEGKLGWDDPVIDHLPGFRLRDPWVTREVTVRDLLTHRAGLGNADLLWYGSDRSRAEILAKIPLIEPAYSPRAGFVYQNIMYIAAGALAGEVAGTGWEELMTARLFEPLGMRRTVATIAATDHVDNVARPHDVVDGELIPIDNARFDAAGPAGTVWSSVSDMSRWLRMVLAEGRWGEEQILSEETVSELLRPQTLLDLTAFYPAVEMLEPHWTTYGLGWFQLDYGSHAVSFHTGSIDGMSAIVGILPAEELGVVVLENQDHAELRHALLWKTIDLWTGETDGRDWSAELKEVYDARAEREEAEERRHEEARVEGTTPSLALERYAGRYTHELLDEIEVSFDAGALRLSVGPTLEGVLEHWNYDTFLMRSDRRWQGEVRATFTLGATGAPAAVELFGLRFDRVADEDPDP